MTHPDGSETKTTSMPAYAPRRRTPPDRGAGVASFNNTALGGFATALEDTLPMLPYVDSAPQTPVPEPKQRPQVSSLDKTVVGGFAPYRDVTVPLKAVPQEEPAIAHPLTPLQRLSRAVRAVRARVDGELPNEREPAALRDAYGVLHLLRERMAFGADGVAVSDLLERWDRQDKAHERLRARRQRWEREGRGTAQEGGDG